jgi:hypothetical protein
MSCYSSSKERITNCIAASLGWKAWIGLTLALIASASALAQPPTLPITSCGTITKSGVYEVDALLTSPGGDCLVVRVSNVTLNLNRQIITGQGSGAGVHVLSNAANAFIEGDDARIVGFSAGIEIDSANALAENFTAVNNNLAGVYLKGARQARVSNFNADSNWDGVRMWQGTGNSVQSFGAYRNNHYGVWLWSTSHNSIGGFDLLDNTIAGLYAGCWSIGPQNAPCKPAAAPSTYNIIYGGLARGGSGGEAYGIAIDFGNNYNKITSTYATGNIPYDFLDENLNCGNNLWFAEGVFYSSQPSACIR